MKVTIGKFTSNLLQGTVSQNTNREVGIKYRQALRVHCDPKLAGMLEVVQECKRRGKGTTAKFNLFRLFFFLFKGIQSFRFLVSNRTPGL